MSTAAGRRKPPCTTCGYVHASDWARAIGLFSDRPITYRAATMPAAPRRKTRDQAEADECSWRASLRTKAAGQAYNRGTSEGPRIAPETPLTLRVSGASL